jgi:hypothetical protein
VSAACRTALRVRSDREALSIGSFAGRIRFDAAQSYRVGG